MTGKPFHKTRTIISQKILSPRVQILDVDTSAISFKEGISQSINAPRLNVNLAIKSLGSGIGAKKKPTYENTDNKTRTNSGGEPGMVVGPRGIRYQPKEKNGPGKELVLFPSLGSRESNGKTSNFGWLKKDPNRSSIKNYIEYQKKKPQIRIRKFKVNPKTDEIIPGSDIEMSPFRKDTNAKNSISEKMLPGKTIGSREASIIGRAAGKFGIVRDALNKFRCPPGTPAANQFTDHTGSNCFGQSAGDLVDFAIDAFRAISKANTEPNSRETLAKFFKDTAYDADNGRFGAFFARTVWRDADGNKIRNLRKWNSELRDGEYKVFTDGMANAQLELETQDARIANLRDLLGVPSTPETRERNDDVHEIFRILKERGMLNVTLGKADPTESGEGERPTYEQVMQVVTARLSAVPGFNELPSEQKKKIIENDAQRFYETERALLEGFLDEYVKNPEHMGTIKNLVYEYKTKDQDEASWAATVVNGQAIGEIRIDIPYIMESQETMLPQLANDERLRIDVTGAKTDAEAAKHLGDFLLTTAQYSKQHAATVEERGFARHIIKHEIAHSIQGRAFFNEIERQINENGFVLIDGKKIESLDDLTGEDLLGAMTDVADSVNLEMLNSALSRTNVVMFLSGAYPRQDNIEGPETKALEATAELWALRNAGLIWGDDVDAALEWMDNIADSRIGEKRARSDVETMRVIQESYYLSPGESSAPWYVPEDPVATAAAKKRAESKVYKKGIEKLDQDLMVEELSILAYEKDLLKGDIDAAEKIGKDTFDLNNQLLDLESREKIVRSVWVKKYGTGESDAKRLKLLVDAKREASASFTPDVLKSKTRAKKITALKEDAAAMDDLQEIIEQMADYDLQLRLSTDIDKKDVKEERKIYMNRYRDVLEESGDSRSWVQQKREMEDKIDQILRPTKTAPLVKPDTPTTDKKATDTASKTREELLRGATPRQRVAILEFSDSKTSDVAKLLDPELRQASLERMKERSRLLKGSPGGIGGVQFDAPTGGNNKPDTDFSPTSRWASTPEEQVENILIPTMEIIDKSRIGANLEIEAEIELDVNDVTGDISLADVSHDSFVSGRVVSKKNPFSTSSQLKPSSNGKQKRRVIIQTTEDDRGIFPHWSMDVDKDDKRPQQLVLPPGKLKVIEIRDDGTVVMQISEQKDTESVLDSLVSAEIKGARFSPVVDRYITERRENKIPREQKRSLRSKETQDRGILATRELKRKGGRFGQGVDDDDMDGLPPSATPTRSQTRAKRIKTKKENLSDVKSVLTGEEPTKFKSLSRDSIDPEVADLIVQNQPDEVIKLIEDSAVELHNSMDKRTRVRMRESELNDFTLTGTYNPRIEIPNLGTEAGPNNRLRRRGKDFKNEAKTVLAAQGARDEFKKLKAANMGNGELHKLDDATLLKDHGLVRATQKSVISDDPVYVSNSAEQAIALLALGYQVEVPDTAERKMVKNAALQTESELTVIAKQEADDLGLSMSEKSRYVKNFMETHDIDLCGLYQPGKNVFCNENIGINREHMPQSSGTTRGANSPALRAMVSGHVKGEYKPVSDLSGDDKAKYDDITAKLSNPKTFKDVSTEDRDWAFGRTNWSETEPKTEKQLMEFLSSVLPDGDKSIIRKPKDPDELFASQKQLRNSQIDKTAKNILTMYMEARDKWGRAGTEEFIENRRKFLETAWFQGAIITSRDGYVVDGHHRWAGIKMLNDHLPKNERIQVQVDELQTSIVEALTLAKVFQEHMEIKGKTVGKVVPYQDGEINPMSKADFDSHMLVLQTQLREKIQDIKDNRIYPFEIKNLSTEPQDLSPVKAKSAGINAITRSFNRNSEKQPITRKSAQIIGAAMSRAGFSWNIRKKVSSAIILISSYDASNSRDTISSFAKNVNNSSGPIIAKMSVKALAAKERIPLHAFNKALSVLGEHKVEHAFDQEERNTELAFNLALKILIDINNSIENQEYKYAIKSEESGLVKSERFKVEKGSSADNYRLKYEEEIGIPSDTPNLLRPISGYIVNKSHIDEKRRRVKQSGSGNYGTDSIFEIQDKDIVGDGLTADGEIEVVLRPETANRVAYGRGNSFDTQHHPVMLDSTEREDIVNAITVNNGLDKDEKMLDTMLHLLGSSKDKNFSHVGAKRDSNGRMKPVGKIDPSSDREHEVFEANILGGFTKDEVEGIHYPFSKVMKLANREDISDVLSFKMLEPKLKKLGFTSDETQYFSSVFNNTPINTPSIQKLKEYRAAQKIKKKYESAGIGYVKFAHPTGINIENPRSYNKTANLKDNPELVIKQNIASEIDGALKDILKKMRKNKTRELIGDPL